MEREIMSDLLEWKTRSMRKPLIVVGARRVGKTWLLKEFGKRYYENVVYLNFNTNKEFKRAFSNTANVAEIIEQLETFSSQKINPKTTLIILDEIEECKEAIHSLKSFSICKIEYHVVSSGSFVSMVLNSMNDFPKDYIETLQMSPMTFSEFLIASGDDLLVRYMKSIKQLDEIPETFCNILFKKLKIYFITGGMPEPVYHWSNFKDISSMQNSLTKIISIYEKDFSRCMLTKDYNRIPLLWHSIPRQLEKENKKFFFKEVKDGARAREYGGALRWLIESGLVNKINLSNNPTYLSTETDDKLAFKLYMFDVGILRRIDQIPPNIIANSNEIFKVCDRALTENFILQSLLNVTNIEPRYWTKVNPTYNIHFLLQCDDSVIPAEVSFDIKQTQRNIEKFNELYDYDSISVRFSLDNMSFKNNILNIPLFLVDYTKELIDIAKSKIS